MYKILITLLFTLILSACATDNEMANSSTSATVLNDEQQGVRYLLGRGVKQNDDKAFYYFKRSAEDENPFAQNELAYLYFSGKGTTRSYVDALYWYQKAADHGLSSAQYNLAVMYDRGVGTDQNKALAREWYQKAAANGFSPAKVALTKSNS